MRELVFPDSASSFSCNTAPFVPVSCIKYRYVSLVEVSSMVTSEGVVRVNE